MRILRVVRNGLAGRRRTETEYLDSIKTSIEAIKGLDHSTRGNFYCEDDSWFKFVRNISPDDFADYLSRELEGFLHSGYVLRVTHETYSGFGKQKHSFAVLRKRETFRIGEKRKLRFVDRTVYSYLSRDDGGQEKDDN